MNDSNIWGSSKAFLFCLFFPSRHLKEGICSFENKFYHLISRLREDYVLKEFHCYEKRKGNHVQKKLASACITLNKRSDSISNKTEILDLKRSSNIFVL